MYTELIIKNKLDDDIITTIVGDSDGTKLWSTTAAVMKLLHDLDEEFIVTTAVSDSVEHSNA